jgi:molecular chaperone GrpE
VKRRGNGGDGDPKPETPGPADTDSSATSLTGVDAAPLEPLTREQVEEMRKERDDLRDQLLRRRADFENYRKRVERDRQQAGVDAAAALLKALVPTLDNLDRALAAPAGEGLREGVELIRRDLIALLEGQGLTSEDPRGQPFDPERHQALVHETAPGHQEGTVVDVFGKGYVYKDRLLRPALVKVAKGPDDDSGGDPGAIH